MTSVPIARSFVLTLAEKVLNREPFTDGERERAFRKPSAISRTLSALSSDIFAKLGDIKGESLDDKHKDELTATTFIPTFKTR